MNYKPSAWQKEFHAISTNEALGGGCAGPGKSLGLLADPLEQVVVEHERCRAGEIQWGRSVGWALHLRREMPRLAQTIHRSKLLFPAIDSGAKWDQQQHKWTFSSGYQYSFGHCKDTDSFLNYRSQEYSYLGIDEVSELDHKDIYDELVTRVRSTDPVLSKMLKVRVTSNPVGNWVRDYFVDPAPEGRKIIKKVIRMGDGTEEIRTRMYLPAKLADNPDADFRRQYEAALRDRPYHIRAALLFSDWYVVAGSFFADAWDESRIVVKPFKIPSGWKRFRSGDWGFANECVILWWAVTPESELLCYRELTLNGPKATQKYDAVGVAQRIKELEIEGGEWNKLKGCSRLTGPMDSQLWQETGHRGPNMAGDMASVGVYWTRATKGRRMAAQQVMKRLMQRGYNDRAGLLFFENCTKCIKTIPALGTDSSPEELGEVPKKGGPDHWYDAVSYACVANPMPSGVEDLAQDHDDDMPKERERFQRGKFVGYV